MKALLPFCFPIISGPDSLSFNPRYKLEQVQDDVSLCWLKCSDTYCCEQPQLPPSHTCLKGRESSTADIFAEQVRVFWTLQVHSKHQSITRYSGSIEEL